MSSSKILVLGGSGMAGHVVSLYLRENGYTVDTLSSTKKLDEDTHLINVSDASKFKKFLSSHHYDVVVNCIGLLVKQSESQKDLAVYINSYLPHLLETLYKDTNTKVIHISTDGVFGEGQPPYKEESPRLAADFYGRSKALGELDNDKDLTFRLSIIGPEIHEDGSGLFAWFMSQSDKIYGFNKVLWSGITTTELARAVKAAIEQDISGIYNLASPKSISKYDLLLLLKKAFNKDNLVVEADSTSVGDKTMVSSRNDFKFIVSSHDEMINEMKQWMLDHKKLYPHYTGIK